MRSPRGSFSLWQRGQKRGKGDCFVFLVYRNNCETRHPHGRLTTSRSPPFMKGAHSLARSRNPRSAYCWRNGATLRFSDLDRSRKEKEKKKKKRKRKRRSFIMELRNCKLSKYNGRTLGTAGPGACILPAPPGPWQRGPNIELRAK